MKSPLTRIASKTSVKLSQGVLDTSTLKSQLKVTKFYEDENASSLSFHTNKKPLLNGFLKTYTSIHRIISSENMQKPDLEIVGE